MLDSFCLKLNSFIDKQIESKEKVNSKIKDLNAKLENNVNKNKEISENSESKYF